MEFTIEEIEAPKTPSEKEVLGGRSSKIGLNRWAGRWLGRLQERLLGKGGAILNPTILSQTILNQAIFRQATFNKGIKALNRFQQITVKGEFILTGICVTIICCGILVTDFITDYRQIDKVLKERDLMLLLAAEDSTLQAEIAPTIALLEQMALYKKGSNILALYQILIAIETRFGLSLFFTEVQKPQNSAEFILKGSAVDLDVLLQLEQFLLLNHWQMQLSLSADNIIEQAFEMRLLPFSAVTL